MNVASIAASSSDAVISVPFPEFFSSLEDDALMPIAAKAAASKSFVIDWISCSGSHSACSLQHFFANVIDGQPSHWKSVKMMVHFSPQTNRLLKALQP